MIRIVLSIVELEDCKSLLSKKESTLGNIVTLC